jgi:tRNA(Ile2) C34 agmatinyltransferase TiaS
MTHTTETTIATPATLPAVEVHAPAKAKRAAKPKAAKMAEVVIDAAKKTAKTKVEKAAAAIEQVIKTEPKEVMKRVSKKALALDIIINNPEAGRKEIMQMFIEQLDMSPAQANTYFYMVKP